MYTWHGLLPSAVFVILPWIVESHSVLDSLKEALRFPI